MAIIEARTHKDSEALWGRVTGCYTLIPEEKDQCVCSKKSAFFTAARLRRNWVSLWAVFDSWVVGTAHAGFVGTLWRIGGAEPKINSLVLDCDLLTSKWSHKIVHCRCTLPQLLESVGSTKETPSHSCLQALQGATERCCMAVMTKAKAKEDMALSY